MEPTLRSSRSPGILTSSDASSILSSNRSHSSRIHYSAPLSSHRTKTAAFAVHADRRESWNSFAGRTGSAAAKLYHGAAELQRFLAKLTYSAAASPLLKC